MLSFSKQTMVRCKSWRNIPQELTARLQSTLGQMQPELAYPMAIRLPPLPSRGNLAAKDSKCKHRPSAMKKNSRGYNHAARDRTNSGTLKKIGECGQRRRMNCELAVIRNSLNDDVGASPRARAGRPSGPAGQQDHKVDNPTAPAFVRHWTKAP